MTSSWNYRVLKHRIMNEDFPEEGFSDWFCVHEVFYKKEKPYLCSKEPIKICGENINSLKDQILMIAGSFDKKILNYNSFKKKGD